MSWAKGDQSRDGTLDRPKTAIVPRAAGGQPKSGKVASHSNAYNVVFESNLETDELQTFQNNAEASRNLQRGADIKRNVLT
jgi:hypothetical protein